MAYIKLLSSCRADGQVYETGQEVEVDDNVARQLIAIGRAECATISLEDVAAFTTKESKPAEKPAPAPRRAPTKPAPKED